MSTFSMTRLLTAQCVTDVTVTITVTVLQPTDACRDQHERASFWQENTDEIPT